MNSNYKHGASIRDSNNRREPIYIAWVNMRQRCNNKKKWDYKFYGGRGIGYCKSWESYVNFLRDMGNSYKKHKEKFNNTSLDRIDVNEGYSKENCKWSTRLEQSNNRNYNVLVNYRGKSQTCGNWVEELGLEINRKELYKRIFTRGWDIKRAMTQPKGVKYRVRKAENLSHLSDHLPPLQI